jgi:hypothetical protein
MSISKIVVTGGPCGGKTTALSRIQRDLSHLGYTVLIVPETATALLSGGSGNIMAVGDDGGCGFGGNVGHWRDRGFGAISFVANRRPSF